MALKRRTDDTLHAPAGHSRPRAHANQRSRPRSPSDTILQNRSAAVRRLRMRNESHGDSHDTKRSRRSSCKSKLPITKKTVLQTHVLRLRQSQHTSALVDQLHPLVFFLAAVRREGKTPIGRDDVEGVFAACRAVRAGLLLQARHLVLLRSFRKTFRKVTRETFKTE